MHYAIYRRYDPKERWSPLFYSIKSQTILNKRLNALLATEGRFYVQLRDETKNSVSTYFIKEHKLYKIIDPLLTADPT